MRPESTRHSSIGTRPDPRARRHPRRCPTPCAHHDLAKGSSHGPEPTPCRVITRRLVALARELDRLCGLPEHASLRRAQRRLRDAASQLDALTFEHCPSAIDEIGLARAIERHALEHAPVGLHVEVHEVGRARRLTPEQARLSFGAARELLHNALKHARAHRVTFALAWRADTLDLRVRDDGCGMSASQPWLAGGLGLFDLRARLLGLGGRLEIDSTPGAGTTIALAIPLTGARWDARRPPTPGPDGELAPDDRARRQLARDLHDSVGQLLPAIKLELEAHGARSQAPGVLALVARLTALIHDVRLLTFELYPAMLEDLGLRATLAHYATRLAATGAIVHVHEAGSSASLGHARALFAFQATHTLLQAVLHAQAPTEIVVGLSWRATGLRVCVDAPLPPTPDERERALRDLRERGARLGCSLRQETSEGACVRFVLDVPLPACASERAPVTALALAGVASSYTSPPRWHL